MPISRGTQRNVLRRPLSWTVSTACASRELCPSGRAGASGPDTRTEGSGQWLWPEPDTEWHILKADVTEAHRRIKIHPQDWRYQVAQIGDEWWVNKVGTNGMASAQLYWGRMAALLLRITYAVFPEIDWALSSSMTLHGFSGAPWRNYTRRPCWLFCSPGGVWFLLVLGGLGFVVWVLSFLVSVCRLVRISLITSLR